MTITYLGHSCFKVESRGYVVVLDPYEEGSVPGYGPVREEADAVLCSHGHRDHGAVGCVALRQGEVSPFAVETIHTWHDDRQGVLRGPDTIHILDDGQCRVAHLGDLGCELTPEQKEKLKGLTALLIPVGGYYTVDAVTAKGICDALKPRTVVPMHYRFGSYGFANIGTADAFLSLWKPEEIHYLDSPSWEPDGTAAGVYVPAFP